MRVDVHDPETDSSWSGSDPLTEDNISHLSLYEDGPTITA